MRFCDYNILNICILLCSSPPVPQCIICGRQECFSSQTQTCTVWHHFTSRHPQATQRWFGTCSENRYCLPFLPTRSNFVKVISNLTSCCLNVVFIILNTKRCNDPSVWLNIVYFGTIIQSINIIQNQMDQRRNQIYLLILCFSFWMSNHNMVV